MDRDLEELQGTWRIVALEVDGQESAAGDDATIAIDGDRFTTAGMGAVYEGTVTIDSSQEPRTIDLKFTSGPEKGNTNRGIYELGRGRWRICLDMRGKGRPEKFATEPGSGRAIEVLRRKTKRVNGGSKVAVDFSELPEHPAPELEGEWEMVSCVQSGEPMPKSWLKLGRRLCTGNRITISMSGQVVMSMRFTVDPSHPGQIDYIVAAGPSAGLRQYGIFRLDGDLLKTSIAAAGAPRPSDFKCIAGDGLLVTRWRRIRN